MAIVNYDEAGLARQRALAEQLRQGAMTGTGGAGMQGQVYIVGNQLGNMAQGLGSVFLNRDAKKKEGVLQGQRDAEVNEWAASKPSMMNPDGTQKAFPQLMQEMSDWQAKGVTSKNPAILKAALKGLEDYGDMPYKMETLKVGGEQKAMLQEARLASAQMLLDQKLAQTQAQFERTTDLKEKLALREEVFEMKKLQAQLENKLTEMKTGSGLKMEENAAAQELKNEEQRRREEHDLEVERMRLSAKGGGELSKKSQEEVTEINSKLAAISNALKLIDENPNALGLKTLAAEKTGDLGQYMLNKNSSKEEIATRAAIGSITAEEIHRLSGAAVTKAEQPRLEKFLPASRDDARVTKIKLKGMQLALEAIVEAKSKGTVVPFGTFDAINQAVGLDAVANQSDNPDQVGETVMSTAPRQKVEGNAAPGEYPAPILDTVTARSEQPTVVKKGHDKSGRLVEKLSDGTLRYAGGE